MKRLNLLVLMTVLCGCGPDQGSGGPTGDDIALNNRGVALMGYFDYGAARDQLRWTRSQIEIEANGVGDNPIFLPEDQVVLTGANFQGTPISMPLDTLGGKRVQCRCRRFQRSRAPALRSGRIAGQGDHSA